MNLWQRCLLQFTMSCELAIVSTSCNLSCPCTLNTGSGIIVQRIRIPVKFPRTDAIEITLAAYPIEFSTG